MANQASSAGNETRFPPPGDDRFVTTDRPAITFHEYVTTGRDRLSGTLMNLFLNGKEDMDIINTPTMVTDPSKQVFVGAVPDDVPKTASDFLPQYMTKINSHLAGELLNNGTPTAVPNPEQLADMCAVWDRIKKMAQNNSPGLLKKEAVGQQVGIMLQFLFTLLLANYGPGDVWDGLNFKYDKSWVVRSTKHGQVVYFDASGNAVIMPSSNDNKFTQMPSPFLQVDQRFPAQCVGIKRGFGSLFGGGGSSSSSAAALNVPPMGQLQALPPGQVSPPAKILAGTFASMSAFNPRHSAEVAQQYLSSLDPEKHWVELHWPANANSSTNMNSGPSSSGIGGPSVFNGQ
eukprot:g9539.t1